MQNLLETQERSLPYVVSGDVSLDEFTVMMNQYVPTSTLGLRDLFNTFGQ